MLSYFDDSRELTSYEVAKELDFMSYDDLLGFKKHIEELKKSIKAFLI